MEKVCYLFNRSPSLALEDKTPQEICTGKKPSLSHLGVFGCDAYVHVPKEKRTKLDSQSEKCIFVRPLYYQCNPLLLLVQPPYYIDVPI